MKRVLVTLGSKNPGLLMNPMSVETLEGIRTKKTVQKRRDWTREEEAETKLSWGDTYGAAHVIGIPANNLFACLVNAGRLVKNGKLQLSTTSDSKVPGYIELEEEFLPFKDLDGTGVENSWVALMMRGTNPGGGEAVPVVRPLFKRWEIDVVVLIDDDIDNSIIRELFNKAGRFYGLGDFRPQKKGRFGRFSVTSWVDLGSVEADEIEVADVAGNGDVATGKKARVKDAVTA